MRIKWTTKIHPSGSIVGLVDLIHVASLKVKDHKDTATYKQLISPNGIPSCIYRLVKIYKEGYSLGNVASTIGFPTYKFLVKTLKALDNIINLSIKKLFPLIKQL